MSRPDSIEKPKQKPHSDRACSCPGCADFKFWIDHGVEVEHVWNFEESSGPLQPVFTASVGYPIAEPMPQSDDLAIVFVGTAAPRQVLAEPTDLPPPPFEGWHRATVEIDRTSGRRFIEYADGRLEELLSDDTEEPTHEQCTQCGVEILGCHACQGVPGGFPADPDD